MESFSWAAVAKGGGKGGAKSAAKKGGTATSTSSNNNDDKTPDTAQQQKLKAETVEGKKEETKQNQQQQGKKKKKAPGAADFALRPTPETAPLLFGLRNSSIYCYVNSVLQSLCSVAPFWSMMQRVASKRIPPACVLLRALAELYSQASASDASFSIGSDAPVLSAPMALQQVIANEAQEDAHEYLLVLLDRLHREINSLSFMQRRKKQREKKGAGGDAGWDTVGREGTAVQVNTVHQDDSFIEQLFQLRTRVAYTKTSAKNDRITVEPMRVVSVELPKGVKSVQQAMLSAMRRKAISDKTNSYVSMEVERLPPYLIVHLKRFYFDQRRGICKNEAHIDFSGGLDLSSVCARSSKQQKRFSSKYRLVAAITHVGRSVERGHYIADVCKGSGEASFWMTFNDEATRGAQQKALYRDRTPYLLFYERLPA